MGTPKEMHKKLNRVQTPNKMKTSTITIPKPVTKSKIPLSVS